jgi:alkanesulfonate monooxygenase SsuD/methylene tetrahydromethanopterin reductase-like flavin-dependent oxidoreductase (luciferase family)
VLAAEGWAEVQPQLNALSKTGGYAEMRGLITAEMVSTIGVCGTPEECAAEIGRRFGAYASEICCYFPGYTPAPENVADLVAALQRLPDPS